MSDKECVTIDNYVWLEDPFYHLGGGQRYIPITVTDKYGDSYHAALVPADEDDDEEAMRQAKAMAKALCALHGYNMKSKNLA